MDPVQDITMIGNNHFSWMVKEEKKVCGTDLCDNLTSWFSQWKSPIFNKEQENQIFALEARNVVLEKECERLQHQNHAMEEEMCGLKKQLEQNKIMSIVGFDLKTQIDEVIMMRTSQKMRDVSELRRLQEQVERLSKERNELQQRVVDLLHRGTTGTSSVSSNVPSRRSFGDEISPSISPRPPASRKVSMNSASVTAQSLLSGREYDMVRNAAIRVSLSTEQNKGIDISQRPQQPINPRTRQLGRYPDEFHDVASDSGVSEFISASSVASNLPGRSRCNSTLSHQPCHGRDADVAFGVTPSEFDEDCMLSDYGSSVFEPSDKSETNTVPFSDFGVGPHKLFEFVSFLGSPKPCSTSDVPTSTTGRDPIAADMSPTASNKDKPVLPASVEGSSSRKDNGSGRGSVSSETNGSELSGGTNASPMSVVDLFGGWL